MYKLAIFDLDGTILDTLEDLANSTNHALSRFDMPVHSIEEIRSFVGNGIANLIHRSVVPGTDEETEVKVLNAFKDHYKDHCADCTKPYAGIPELLSELRDEGVLTAVVSNKADFAVQSLIQIYFADLFDYAVGERAGVKKKPAPDSVLSVLNRLDVGAEDAVYIGDSDVDIETAVNAGLKEIAVDWGFRNRDFLREHGAETIVSSVDELRKSILD